MIVDALTHILPAYFNEHRDEVLTRDLTFAELFANPRARIVQAEHLLEEMDRSGVGRSVIAGFGWTDQELAKRSNDYLLESAAQHPDKLIPLCSVNPLWGNDAAPREIERCISAGARGIGELHADMQGWVDGPYDVLSEVMSVARSHNAVVTVHSSEPVGHTYHGKGAMTPSCLLRLVAEYPDNLFVFSHFGGGLPFYAHMPEVRDMLKNVWFDSAASPYLYEPSVYETTTKSAGESRILFASDYPLLSQRRALNHLKDAEISQAVRRAILEGAARLYDSNR